MTPDDARALFLPVHGLVGVLALLGGFGALAARKGSRLHRLAGRVFVVAMAGAIVVAVPVLVATGNLFLTGMGGFAAYLTWTGWRIARLKSGPASPLDRAVSVLMIGAGLGFAGYGAWAVTRGVMLGLVPVAMGLGGAWLAVGHLRWFRTPIDRRGPWVPQHLGAVGGGLIAGLTAFAAAALTNYLPAVPEPLVWLAPGAILGPLLARETRRR